MKVTELISQLQYLLDNDIVSIHDEVILIGSGNKKTDAFKLGLIMPKVELDKETLYRITNDNTGYYGIGFTNSTVHSEMFTSPHRSKPVIQNKEDLCE